MISCITHSVSVLVHIVAVCIRHTLTQCIDCIKCIILIMMCRCEAVSSIIGEIENTEHTKKEVNNCDLDRNDWSGTRTLRTPVDVSRAMSN